MTAETLTALQAQSDARVPSPTSGPHQICTIWGEYSIAANVEDGDIFELCHIPAGFLVLGGTLHCADIDTGTEAVDIDLGWAASGPSSAATFIDANDKTHTDVGYQADPDGFVNSGVFTGDAITDLLAGGNMRPFPLLTGPLYFDKKTTVQAEANVAAATFAAGKLWCVIWGVFIKV